MDPFGVLEALIGTFFVILLLNDGDSEDPRQASVVIITFINTHEYWKVFAYVHWWSVKVANVTKWLPTWICDTYTAFQLSELPNQKNRVQNTKISECKSTCENAHTGRLLRSYVYVNEYLYQIMDGTITEKNY